MGTGLQHLAARRVGETREPDGSHRPVASRRIADKPRALLLGGGVGIPPMVFLAETLRDRAAEGFKPFAVLGSELPFPFRARPSTIVVPGMPDGVIAAMPLLDSWGVPSRLTTKSGFPGCHDGYVTDLARLWLAQLDAEARGAVELFACGPTPMLKAVARAGARILAALPGLAGGIHGLRRGRLRRLRGGSGHARGPVDGAGLRGWTGVRRLHCVLAEGRRGRHVQCKGG